MKIKEHHGYANLDHKILRYLFRNPIFGLLSHWIFQGMLYMDPSERWFKLGIDLGITILVGSILTMRFSRESAFLMAFVLAHTLNFLFNGHLWATLRYYGMAGLNYDKFENYHRELSKRLYSESSVVYAAVYGSLVRDEWGHQSDLDIRLVRSPGFMSCMRACIFVLLERTRALLSAFPLDIYVLDDFKGLHKLRDDEIPRIIKNDEEYIASD